VLYVFSDGPKDEAASHDVARVRQLLSELRDFSDTKIVLRDRNYGLSRNIIDGLGEVFGRHDEAIVLEDDIVVSPHFLRFMNDALSLYRHDHRVTTISGYCYPIPLTVPETFFLGIVDCWGWATWRDRWAWFNLDGKDLLRQLQAKDLERAFDMDGAMPYTRMLEDQIAGRNDSWAIRWLASCFLRGTLTLYPSRSLVQNIGLDGVNATHCGKTDIYDVMPSQAPIPVGGIAVEESGQAREAFQDFLRMNFRRSGRLRRAWQGMNDYVAGLVRN
jgi:hypothetical protein